jgi:hypothetical protein
MDPNFKEILEKEAERRGYHFLEDDIKIQLIRPDGSIAMTAYRPKEVKNRGES